MYGNSPATFLPFSENHVKTTDGVRICGDSQQRAVSNQS